LSGMFLIKGVKTVETVFCDFTLAATDPSKLQYAWQYGTFYLNEF
jgi:hypothetical protein